jgi:hypothetical protein
MPKAQTTVKQKMNDHSLSCHAKGDSLWSNSMWFGNVGSNRTAQSEDFRAQSAQPSFKTLGKA